MDPMTTSKRNKYIALFLVAYFCISVGFQTRQVVFDNFLVENLGIGGFQRGFLASVREIPGALTVVLAVGTAFMAESLLGVLCILIMAGGAFILASVDQYYDLFLPLLLISTGIHLFMPIRSAVALGLSRTGEKGKRMGQVESISAIAYLAAAGIVWLTAGALKYRGIFVLSGGVALIGAAVMAFVPSKGQVKTQKFVVRQKYWLFYALTLLGGCRRQIFTTFARFALVSIHGVHVKTIAALTVASSLTNVFTRTAIGLLIDRLGEKRSLVISYLGVTIIFLGYAYISSRQVLYLLYWLDSLFMGFEIARTTYLDKIAPHRDIMPTLSFGVTMNHILAIPMPILGGYLWDRYGYANTFLLGVSTVILSALILRKMDDRIRQDAAETDLESEVEEAAGRL